jgi:VRR-NUC domain
MINTQSGGRDFGKTAAHKKHSESLLQQACVKWYRFYSKLPYMLIAIKNGSKLGGKRSANGFLIEAAIAKKEGVTAGVADLMLLYKNSQHGALFIEMKFGKNKQSPEQKNFQKYCDAHSYAYVVCYAIDEFMDTVKNYVNNVKKH